MTSRSIRKCKTYTRNMAAPEEATVKTPHVGRKKKVSVNKSSERLRYGVSVDPMIPFAKSDEDTRFI